MIYLDNAATSGFKPECVKAAINATLKNLSCNPGRSGHKLSINCLKLITKTRENIAKFFNCDNPDNVIFTKNCTEALNVAILGSYVKGSHVVTSINEHNSVLRPLFELEKKGEISLTVCDLDENGNITYENVKKCIKDNTSLICLNLVSNVTGGSLDMEKLGTLKGKNIKLICDAAQAAGYIDIDMKKTGIDMLAFPGHKGLYGPTGTGGLCFMDKIKIRPLMFGGTGTESENIYQPDGYPENLESGTLNIVGIAGLNAGLNYIKEHKIRMRSQLKFLQKLFFDQCCKIKNIKIYSSKNHSGIISLLAEGYTSMETSDLLSAKYDIAVRGGLHCAPLVHKHLHTSKSGLVRFSLSSFNNFKEIAKALEALKEITKITAF